MRADLAAAEAADHIALLGEQDPGAVSVPGVRQRAGAQAPVCTTLTIPAPPSVNKLFKNNRVGAGRSKTLDYKNWLAEVSWRIREQLAQPGCDRVPGRVVIVVAVERVNLMADCDNYLKGILDALVKQRAIDDDRFVTSATVVWAPMGNRQRQKARILIVSALQPLNFNFHPSPDGATGGWFLDAPDDDGEV